MRLWEPASRQERFIGIAFGVIALILGLASGLLLLWIGRGGDVLLSISLGCGVFGLVFAGGIVASVARDGKYELRDNVVSAALVGFVLLALSLTLICMMRSVEIVEFYYKWREAAP